MKVDCYPEELPDRSWWWNANRPRTIQVKRILPFCMSPLGTRMHRCRTGVLYPPLMGGDHRRLVPHPWCGVSASHFKLFADPGGWEVCGTCEGRAIGAGQIPAPPGYDFDLLFSPRLPVARCGWDRGVRSYGGTYYSNCGGRGAAVASRGDEIVVVCRTHRRSAISKGWDITEGAPLDANRS